MVHEIAVSRIKIKSGRRLVRNADALAKSIQEIGLLNPISVTPSMILIAGGRRLEAFKILGKAMIPANVLTLDDLHAELAEIDENLERSELTELEQGEQYARRKEIYEVIHPEAKPIWEKGGPGRGHKKTEETISSVSFADDTAEKAGVSARSIRQSIQIADNIEGDVKDMIKGTPLEDRKVDLLDVARLPKEQQKPVVEEVLKNKKTTVSKAKENLGLSKPKPAKVPQSLADKLFPATTSNGPVGKSKVNGEIVDDPPDVAERRRQGKIAPNAIPEVDDPGEDTTSLDAIKEEHEERQAIQADLSDDDWLATLPLSSKLEGVPLKTFQGEAVTYRKWQRQIKARQVQGKEIWNQIKRKGPFAHRMERGSNIDPPEKWLRCPSLENGGCNGEGRLRLGEGDLAKDVGQCTRCFGKGYWIK